MTTVSLKVYESDNTTLVGNIAHGQWRDARWGEANSKAIGCGPVTLPHTLDGGAENPALALIETGRIIRFLVDGTPRGAMLIEDTAVEVVSPREEAGEVTAVTGRSHLAVLGKVQVRPDMGTGVLPHYPTRFLNFSATRLRDDDPDGPQGAWPFSTGQLPNYDTDNFFGRPEGFVDTAGPAGSGPEWLWDRDSRVSFAPAGTCYFRQRFTLASTQDVIVEFAADDQGELWVDNVPVCRVEGVYKGGAVRSSVRLSAGEHLIGAWGQNLNALRAGVVYAVWSVSDGMPDTLLARSDDALARVLGYPADPPGFTPTEVIRLLVDEAQALTPSRLSNVTFSFISASDTEHTEVSEVTDIACEAPGESILTVVERLGETYLDVGIRPDSLMLDAWVRGNRGTDRSAYIIFERGNCRRVAWDIGGAERATVALVSGEGFAPFEWPHPDAALTGVYEEVALDFGPASRSSAQRYATEYLNLVSQGRKGVTIEILPTATTEAQVTIQGIPATIQGEPFMVGESSAPRPYADFQIGDWITIPGSDGSPESHRVAAIGCRVDSGSVLNWEVDLDQPRRVIEERLDAIMRRGFAGFAGGRTLLPSATRPSFPTSEATGEGTETWSSPESGTVVLRRNGVAVPGASLAADGPVTLTDAVRKCVAGDVVDITIGGTAGFTPFPISRITWLQHMTVASNAQGTTVVLRYV